MGFVHNLAHCAGFTKAISLLTTF